MDLRTKIMVSVLPIMAGGGIAFSLVMPAFQEFSEKSKLVDDKKTEHQDLKTKLAEKDKIQREVKLLNDTIEQLRAAVPKKAQSEILNLDMERMCLDSGMEMISFTEPDKDTLKKAGVAPEEDSPGTNMTKGKQAFADRVNKTIAGGAGAAAGAAGAAGKVKKAETGLAKFTIQVKALGDYQSVEKLVRKIETYKRVVAITELKCWIPKKDERTKEQRHELPDEGEPKDEEAVAGDWKKLWVSFLITAYYLP